MTTPAVLPTCDGQRIPGLCAGAPNYERGFAVSRSASAPKGNRGDRRHDIHKTTLLNGVVLKTRTELALTIQASACAAQTELILALVDGSILRCTARPLGEVHTQCQGWCCTVPKSPCVCK
jgi:hypothetical protein